MAIATIADALWGDLIAISNLFEGGEFLININTGVSHLKSASKSVSNSKTNKRKEYIMIKKRIFIQIIIWILETFIWNDSDEG